MRVFISYARDDSRFADRLAEDLKKVGHEVWSDKQILPGDNWAAAIGEALNKAQVLIALVSPAALSSEFVQKEWDFALGSEQFQDRLIPVEVKPTRDAPWILARLHPVRASSPGEASKVVLARLASLRESRSRTRASP